MPYDRNRIAELLGSDPSDASGLRKGLAGSPISQLNNIIATQDDANYSTIYNPQFNLATIPSGLTLTEEGTTTAAATYTGQATMTSDDVAAKTDQFTTPLSWRCDKQSDKPLIFQCRWKTGATITASEYWIGLTDASPDTDPIALSTTSTFTTSVPTDGVYMGYSATPTSGGAFTTGGNQHAMLAIKADANTLVGVGGGAFAAATFYNYRIEVDVDGTTRFYVNGTLLGTQASALTVTAPLCAMICASPRTTVSAAITVKSVLVAGVGT